MRKILLFIIITVSTVTMTSCGGQALTPEMQSIYDQMKITEDFDENLQGVYNRRRKDMLNDASEKKLFQNQENIVIIEKCKVTPTYFRAKDYSAIFINNDKNTYYSLEEKGKNGYNLIEEPSPTALDSQTELNGAIIAIKEGTFEAYQKGLKISNVRNVTMIHTINKAKEATEWEVHTYFFEY